MKRLLKLIIALCFSAVMLMGCKSKSEKLVASYLKDYEMLASGNFNHSGSGENRQKKSDENDQKSHLLTFTYSIS